MPFGFILVLEPISTVGTFVLFLLLVCTTVTISRVWMWFGDTVSYVSSSDVSNFLGFLGQHSQMKIPWSLPALELLA